MKLFVTLTACLLFFQGFSQFSIRGKVNDESNKGLKSVTVLLFNHKDSSLVKSALTVDGGSFVFADIKQGKYFLKASIIGFTTTYTSVDVDRDVEVADLRLSTSTKKLQDVTVVTTKPFLEQRADKLVVNVESSLTAAGSTALEVLQKVPGLIVVNDKVTMVGKSNIQIMIDGRPSPYTDMAQVLRDMPSSNIEKIEVITNPGAKYDATGGGIINVILKRNANVGTNGNVSLATGYGLYNNEKHNVDRSFYRIVPAFSLNHRKNKLNLFGGYSYLKRTFFQYNEFRRDINASHFIQKNYTPNETHGHNYRMGADYYVNKKNTIGILVRGFTRAGESETRNNTNQFKVSDGTRLSEFNTTIAQDYKRSNLAANLNWKHNFDSLGRDLNIDIDFANFQIDDASNISTTLSNGGRSINNQTVDNPVKFATVKLDYIHPISKDSKLEAGIKSSYATIDNYLVFKRDNVVDNNKSNNFLYQENINAAYASYQQKISNWEFILGLRAEQTVAKGKSGAAKVVDRNYLQLFPSAFLTRKVNKNFSVVSQYSRRVSRPSYQQQNPFIIYLDSLTYTRGNPLIRPEVTDAAKVSLTYQGQPFLAFSYNKTSDVIFQNAPKQEGNLTYATPENLAKFENFVAELNFPLNIGKKLTGYGGNQFIYKHYKADYLNTTYNTGRWNWMAYMQASYKVTPTLTVETSAFYMTRFLEEFLVMEPFGNLNFAIQKSFWEKKGRLTLNFNDILYSNRTRGVIDYENIKLNYMERNESRNVRLVFSYAFGNQKLKAARSRTTGSDSEVNRVKTN